MKFYEAQYRHLWDRTYEEGTHHLAHLGLLLVHLAAGVAEVPREAKVGDLADFIVIHEDVAGGEVAVDYLE